MPLRVGHVDEKVGGVGVSSRVDWLRCFRLLLLLLLEAERKAGDASPCLVLLALWRDVRVGR